MLASRRGTAVYLLFYAANAAVLPVLTLYYESVGVTGARLGILAALWPAGSIVGASAWGAIADATGRHRLVLAVAMLFAAGAAQLLAAGSSFAVLVPVAGFFALSVAPIGPMLDHAVLEDLGDRQERYGRVRLWGAIGWGVAAPLVGIAVDAFGLSTVFPVYGVLMIGLFGVSFTLRMPRTRLGKGIVAGFAQIASNPRWRLFLLTVFVAGTGSTFIHHYLFIYLKSIGGTGTLRGVALAVATVSELLVFGFADRLLRRLRPNTLILVSMGSVGVRMVLYGVISDPVLALVPQLMHGVTFSLLLVAGVSTARDLAPEGMRATAQALFTATHMGAGGITGALLGGLLYRTMSAAQVFLAAGIAETVFMIVFLVIRAAAGGSARRRETRGTAPRRGHRSHRP